ncbi:hypothetical protein AMS68_005032 [Peltaster fructicola]|uniref:GIT Spa2 homology (SHD) domain-containing protein n=1 Tax=Peltaster fructicola TaxID=286661 RepID=A0A6H0XXX7_9PEZI|nr:hypothetical protein AMS68_005032 [Peltaster fructicola]
MNRNNGPLSPASSGRASNGGFMGAPSDIPYSGGPYASARPMQSPPSSSGHPSGSTDLSRPSANSSNGRPQSSASSRSDARGMGMPPNQRDSTRSNFRPEHEDVLQKHYYSLRTYLASHLRDEKGNMKPNRARDKLLRLSVTQFMELSTDVYDELVRREDDRTRRVQNVPQFLPPKQNFHPKRNQARQKLSTLPVERFRQLATDVFFELERRVPRFTGADIDRPISSGSRAPSRGGMRPPPQQGWRGGPPDARSRQPSDASSLGRPLPKNFNGGTVVPNKSTMVEDDDDEELANRFSEMERDKERIKSQEIEIEELKKQLQGREEELEAARQSGEEHESGRSEWSELREELEQKVSDAQRLNDDLHNELEVLRRNKHMDEQTLRDQVDELRGTHEDLQTQLHHSNRDLEELREHHDNVQHQLTQLQLGSRGEGSEEQTYKIQTLEQELATQKKLTDEVRAESLANLLEMRQLSQQNDEAVEREEQLASQVSVLKREAEEWRDRYARVKVQNKSLRASTMGLGLHTSFSDGDLREQGLISPDGLVKAVDMTKFQLTIDDLLKSARQIDTTAMIESVRQVTFSVQSITSDIGTDGYPTPSPSPHSPDSPAAVSVARLKARVTGTANSLITATKQHANAGGLSPVALLDAAASNLTASVIELVKAVGIKPASDNEARDADLDSFYGERTSDTYSQDEMPPPLETAVAVQQGGLARSNTSKKPVGWFNWGRRMESDEDSLQDGHAPAADEYDPYR